jgi:hypothetical protein
MVAAVLQVKRTTFNNSSPDTTYGAAMPHDAEGAWQGAQAALCVAVTSAPAGRFNVLLGHTLAQHACYTCSNFFIHGSRCIIACNQHR